MQPTTLDAPRIVGREVELEALDRFVLDAVAWPGALVVEGSAGIGKSTLLDAGAAAAEGRSCDVLRCRPGEHESRLSFAALRDLLEDVFEETAAALPEPQRQALAVALLREEPDAPLDRGAVSTAFLTLLRARSRDRPVLIVADDAQWLDAPSATVLGFAIRRLRTEAVGVLIARRADAGGAALLGLGRALPSERLRRLTLGPLSLGALQAMLRGRLDRSFPRPLLRRIREASGGNPLFALEIATALDDADVGLDATFSIPRELEQLLRARIEALPVDAWGVLLFVAAASAPTTTLVADASANAAVAVRALAAAEEAGIVEVRADQIRFTHPLLASTVSAAASPADRRSAHRALAKHVADPEERARHLALGADSPDSAVAAALDDAARRARARGAPDSAAELADLARELTPPGDSDALVRRGVEAAGHHFDAGNAVRGQQLLLEMADAAPPGLQRAEILWRLADASWNETDLVRAHLEEARRVAAGNERLECRLQWDLAWTWVYGGDLAAAEREARHSLELAERLDDAPLLPEALAAFGICEFLGGRDGTDLIARAASLPGSLPDVYTTPTVTLALRQLWSGELDAARSTLEPVIDHLASEGLYTLATEPYEILGEIECRAGRFELAARHAATAVEIKLGAGFEDIGGLTLFPLALVEAHRGDVEPAREHAERGLAWSERRGDRFYANANRAVLGFVELSLRRFAEAREHLDAVVEFLHGMGVREPGVIPVLPDAIEARIGVGDLDGAAVLLDELEDMTRARRRPWALATAARGRGSLLAAHGDAAGAASAFRRALDEHPRVGQPLELGRTLLAKGEAERRARQKSAARESVEHAIAIFDEVGASLWSDRARAELARTGLRASSSDGLSPSERHIAELVARGATNKEAAAAAFVSVKTVEANLSRVYAKLGVRSRTALTHRLAEKDRKDGSAEP